MFENELVETFEKYKSVPEALHIVKQVDLWFKNMYIEIQTDKRLMFDIQNFENTGIISDKLLSESYNSVFRKDVDSFSSYYKMLIEEKTIFYKRTIKDVKFYLHSLLDHKQYRLALITMMHMLVTTQRRGKFKCNVRFTATTHQD